MSTRDESTEQTLARAVVRDGDRHLGGLGFKQLGVFWTFTPEEYDQLDAARNLIAEYLRRDTAPRPLCLAVFGAPGSGKSFAVEQIVESLRGEPRLPDAPGIADPVKVNLTQIGSTDELARVLAGAATSAGVKVPLVFFDEFDTDCGGAPWGWLGWFLAPMQDGKFRCEGQDTALGRAIYVFAGGTASRFEAFGRSDPERFRMAKGPDFQSRLRGFIDIAGPDADKHRKLRRATILHRQLGKRRLDDELLDAMLSVGRYRHGARSIEALVEMMGAADPLTLDSLPVQHVLAMHADRGPLDDRVIGGMVGMSGGGPSGPFADTWKATARSLLLDGAKVAYGGKLGHDLTTLLTEVEGTLPARLERRDNERAPPDPWLIRFVATQADDDETTPNTTKTGIESRKIVTRDAELERWRDVRHRDSEQLTNALQLFRMRHAMSLACVARFALGGSIQAKTAKSDGFVGRFPGVVEELMLALAMGQPVYITGGFEGGARWAGSLLGLGDAWRGRPENFAREMISSKLLRGASDLFRPPPHSALPLTRAELVTFFEEHALGGPRWPNNGLSAAENRRLFREAEPEKVADLVRCGLRRRFEGVDLRVR